MAAMYVFLGAFFYAVVYTVWLKRRSALNIVIGGLAGSFAVLAGAAAADPTPGPLPLLLALVLFLWTPPHFWSLAIANRADYAAAGVPMLPVVVGTERAARDRVRQHRGAGGGIAAAAGLRRRADLRRGRARRRLHFLRKSWLLANAADRASAMGSFFASLVQLSALLVAATLDGLLR